MALSGHGAVVRTADTDAAGDIVGGITSFEWNRGADVLETTDLADGQDRARALQGLRDLEATFSGDYESGDAGQARLFTNFEAGTAVWVRWLPNGTTGFKAPFKVESLNTSVSFDGKVEFTGTLKLDASTGSVGTV